VGFDAGGSDYDLIHKNGFAIKNGNADYDMIIVDRYGVDNATLARYKKKCRLLASMDDASPRPFRDRISDVIINGNAYGNERLYGSILRDNLNILAGGRYVPMDRRMCRARNRYHVRKTVSKITVTFGGADSRYTLQICKKIAAMNLDADITVLNGIRLKRKLGRQSRLRLLPIVDNMHEILLQSDVIVCSASSTCWQAAAVGVPCIVFQTADNQRRIFQYVRKAGIGIALTKIEMLEKAIGQMSYDRRSVMSRAARKVVGCEGSQRIAARLHRLLVS
jgi:spore coat polysaccharide biosynthesis predicted glycosyltransferase SpsG